MKNQIRIQKFAISIIAVVLCCMMVGCQNKIKKDTGVVALSEDEIIKSESNAEDLFEALPEDSYQERAIIRSKNLSRIEDVMERAANGEEITIGYIGGSITMGSGASNNSKCYASLVSDWWTTTYPDATFTVVNAGIGATDSKFACARCEDDLLSYEPDFVIVEFSVNDGTDTTFSESYESLVRMILDAPSEPAVLILNMVTYDTGYSAQDTHNVVAFRYNLPVVSMKTSIYQDIEDGILKATDVSSDMTHPNDQGHAYASEIITYFLEKVRLHGFEDNCYEPYSLPEPTRTLTSMNSKRIQGMDLNPELSGFILDTEEQNGITDIFKKGFYASDEGAYIKCTVEGSIIILQYRITKDMTAPSAEVIIDSDEDNPIMIQSNEEGGWGDWLCLTTVYQGTDEEHTVELRLTENGDKPFYLVSVITAD